MASKHITCPTSVDHPVYARAPTVLQSPPCNLCPNHRHLPAHIDYGAKTNSHGKARDIPIEKTAAGASLSAGRHAHSAPKGTAVCCLNQKRRRMRKREFGNETACGNEKSTTSKVRQGIVGALPEVNAIVSSLTSEGTMNEESS